MPEYLVLFRKWKDDGKNPEPVRHYKTAEDAETTVQMFGRCLICRCGRDTQAQCGLIFAEPTYLTRDWHARTRTKSISVRCSWKLSDARCSFGQTPVTLCFHRSAGSAVNRTLHWSRGSRAVAAELKPGYFAQMARNCEEVCKPKNEDQVTFGEVCG